MRLVGAQIRTQIVGDDKLTPEQDRTLSGAVLEAIGDYQEIDPTETDFTLYDHIDPASLDTLCYHDTAPNAIVMFSVDEVPSISGASKGSKSGLPIGRTTNRFPQNPKHSPVVCPMVDCGDSCSYDPGREHVTDLDFEANHP